MSKTQEKKHDAPSTSDSPGEFQRKWDEANPSAFKKQMKYWQAVSEKAEATKINKVIDELLADLDKAWSFDNGQQHTHSWHDKQDFMERWRARQPGETAAESKT